MVIEGVLHRNITNTLVIEQDDGRCIAVEDTLLRNFSGKRIRVTIEEGENKMACGEQGRTRSRHFWDSIKLGQSYVKF